ncbi:MAG: ornithine aminomutase subunit alpha [Eubacteriales bacterium]|nr:ornithine aminomutase subunit alpha [Eubacteriales bacterium]
MPRPDDFEKRRAHLRELSDEEIYERFWQLANQLVDPLLEAGKIYTTPAIERSILLRMGFSSVDAKPLVDQMIERELLNHGAGHLIWRLGQHWDIDYLEAGQRLLKGEGWTELAEIFGQEVQDD